MLRAHAFTLGHACSCDRLPGELTFIYVAGTTSDTNGGAHGLTVRLREQCSTAGPMTEDCRLKLVPITKGTCFSFTIVLCTPRNFVPTQISFDRSFCKITLIKIKSII